MLPEIIDNTNFRYIVVDNKYVSSMCIKTLPEKIYFLDIIKDIKKDVDYDMSIYIKKLDSVKILNDITYNLASNQGELYTINKNQRNIDIIQKTNEDAKKLRKKIQVENQEIYDITIIFTFYSYDLNQLLKILSSIKAKFYSRQISADITNFRHLEFYLSNLPLGIDSNKLNNKLYITTDALANIFPFYSNNFVDKNGVLIGYTKIEKRVCMMDIFSKKYENANMCIFGSSGSGKSFFTKLFILRNFFQNKFQIILDIENEYIDICKNLGGQVVFDNTYFNILQVTQLDIQKKDFLEYKINKIIAFLKYVCDLKDIEINELKKEIKSLYKQFHITNDINSILKENNGEKVYLDYEIIDSNRFPTLEDLKEHVQNIKLKEFLEKEISSNLRFFSKHTNIDLNSNLYVICINSLMNNSNLIINILNGILERINGDKESVIYIDEMWKYAKNEKVLDSIFNMYKTIRKRKGAIVTITQDITDFFTYKEGFYAKSILNNSCFKMIFKTEYKENSLMNSILSIEQDKLANLSKGEAYLVINKNSVHLKIDANKYEREIINEDDNSYK